MDCRGGPRPSPKNIISSILEGRRARSRPHLHSPLLVLETFSSWSLGSPDRRRPRNGLLLALIYKAFLFFLTSKSADFCPAYWTFGGWDPFCDPKTSFWAIISQSRSEYLKNVTSRKKPEEMPCSEARLCARRVHYSTAQKPPKVVFGSNNTI